MGAMSRALAQARASARPSSGQVPPAPGSVPLRAPLSSVATAPAAATVPQLDQRGATVMQAAPTFQRMADESEQQQRAALRRATSDAEASARASMAAVVREFLARQALAESQQQELLVASRPSLRPVPPEWPATALRPTVRSPKAPVPKDDLVEPQESSPDLTDADAGLDVSDASALARRPRAPGPKR